jgi:hypothetical protein
MIDYLIQVHNRDNEFHQTKSRVSKRRTTTNVNMTLKATDCYTKKPA